MIKGVLGALWVDGRGTAQGTEKLYLLGLEATFQPFSLTSALKPNRILQKEANITGTAGFSGQLPDSVSW